MSRRFLNSSLLHLSFNVTPHIHPIIILSVLSILRISSALIVHVSLPYTIARYTHIPIIVTLNRLEEEIIKKDFLIRI